MVMESPDIYYRLLSEENKLSVAGEASEEL